MTPADRRARDRARARARRFTNRHADHDIGIRSRIGADGQPYRYCISCTADVDPAAVQRAVDGDPPARLRPAERRAAVARLRPGLTAARIAEQLRVADRTVWRDLAAIRAGAAV